MSDRVLMAVVIAAAPLFFYALGQELLWQDEAQTALLGRSILQHGVPLTGTGADSVSANLGTEAGLWGLHLQISWLQSYLVAGSFAALGESAFAARLPFAIVGWLCLPALYLVAMRLRLGRTAARMAVVFLAGNISFLIISRQARYYTLAALSVLWVVQAYARFVEQSERQPDSINRRAVASLVGSLSFAGVSFDLTAVGLLAAVATDWVLFRARQGPWRQTRAIATALLLAAVPLGAWIVLASTAPSRRDVIFAPTGMMNRLVFYIAHSNAHFFPLLLVAVAVGALIVQSRSRDLISLATRLRIPALMAATVVATATMAAGRYPRYVVGALPLVVLIGVAVVYESLRVAGRTHPSIFVVVILLLVTTSAPFRWSHDLARAGASRLGIRVHHPVEPLTIPLLDLIGELRDPPHGPVAAVVEFLRHHANENDILVTSYGDLPLKFHTSLKVYGGETGQLPPGPARWIWPRLGQPTYGAMLPAKEYIDRQLRTWPHEAYDLGVPDRRWENREDPHWHLFRNPPDTRPHVRLYRRTGAP